MKTNSVNTLAMTAQTLGVISQLLAIGIEVGIVAGGYFVYKKITENPQKPPVSVPENCDVVFIPTAQEIVTFKQKWAKAKKIPRAVVG